MKTAYILQPGKLGDLIITTPIANYYKNNGYNIKWFAFDNFKNYFKYFNYIEPIFLDYYIKNYFSNTRNNLNSFKEQQETYKFFCDSYVAFENNKQENDIFLDISWGFAGSSVKNNALINFFNSKDINWIDMRYKLANVPLKERWNFSWNRDEKKEDNLLDFIKEFSKKKFGSETFSICHNYTNNENNVNFKNQINFAYIEGYEIFDWYKVLLEAENIACVDSSLCNFVEVLPQLKDKNKIYLGSEEPHYFKFMRNILLNNWQDVNKNKIESDYIGKI